MVVCGGPRPSTFWGQTSSRAEWLCLFSCSIFALMYPRCLLEYLDIEYLNYSDVLVTAVTRRWLWDHSCCRETMCHIMSIDDLSALQLVNPTLCQRGDPSLFLHCSEWPRFEQYLAGGMAVDPRAPWSSICPQTSSPWAQPGGPQRMCWPVVKCNGEREDEWFGVWSKERWMGKGSLMVHRRLVITCILY